MVGLSFPKNYNKVASAVVVALAFGSLVGCKTLDHRTIAAESNSFGECIASNAIIGGVIGGLAGGVIQAVRGGDIATGIGYGALVGGITNTVFSWSICSDRFKSIERVQVAESGSAGQSSAFSTSLPLALNVNRTTFAVIADEKSSNGLVVKVDSNYDVLSNDAQKKDIAVTERFRFWLPTVQAGRVTYSQKRMVDMSSTTRAQLGQRLTNGKIPLPSKGDLGELLGQEWIGVFSVQNLKGDVCSARAQVFKTNSEGVPEPQGQSIDVACDQSFGQMVQALNNSSGQTELMIGHLTVDEDSVPNAPHDPNNSQWADRLLGPVVRPFVV